MLIDRVPEGTIIPPGSKSISHRGVICAALAGGGTIFNAADNMDIQATLECMRTLGAQFVVTDGSGAEFKGFSPRCTGELNCGESGSTMRFLIPVAAALGGEFTFTGGGRLMDRPMDIYTSCLAPRGVTAEKRGGLFLVKGQLKAGVFNLPGDVSSQFVTGLLFALPMLSGDSEIVLTSPLQSRAYVDLTLECLKQWGIKVINQDYKLLFVPGGQKYRPHSYTVEADYSAAAFMLAAGVLGCNVRCGGLNPTSLQGDRAFLDILYQCGADVSWIGTDMVKVTGGSLKSLEVDVSEIPDLVPALAVVMCFCEGESRITNAARLRIKESDRLDTVSRELNRLGGRIEQGEDFLIIQGVNSFSSAKCLAHNDHRIAMMAAVASIRAQGAVELDDPDCVKKSYPNFWRDFLKVKRG